MDGYDIMHGPDLDGKGQLLVTRWRVYVWDKGVLYYKNAYRSYRDMIAAHPELHDIAMIKALPLLNNR